MKTKIPFDELYKYSDLPEKLLSNKKAITKVKSHEEVIREFEREKWRKLLGHLKTKPDVDIVGINKILMPENDAPIVSLINNSFYLTKPNLIEKEHINIYSKILSKYIDNSDALVELGAGYGSKILTLSKIKSFSKLNLFAGELTVSGQRLIKLISQNMGKKISVGFCDFRTLNFSKLNIPENSIIFSSYAAHYVPYLKDQYVEKILQLKPKIVVHFEPLYEIQTEKTIFESMCKKYIEINDYNRNLYSQLIKAQKNKKIELKIKKNVIGSNPFLPISIIEWSPK